MVSDDNAPDRPIFCGNFEYDASEREIVRLFEKYGPVERIDMKTGFAFLYMRDKRDGEDAIRALDRREFGYKRRPLKVEWAKKSENKGKDQQPTTTLFVVNFDVMRTVNRDLQEYYSRYGRLSRVEIKRNYAFVEFEDISDAITAQRKTHQASFNGRTLTVEFCTRNDRNESRGYGSERDRERSPPPARRRSPSPTIYGRRRSPSPAARRDSRSPRRYSPPARRGSPERSRRRSPRSRSRSPYKPADSPADSRGRSRSPMRD